MHLRQVLLVGTAVVGLAGAVTTPASANYSFTGSGASGNFVGQASESWILNADGGTFAGNNWGSPGVGAGTIPYLETDSAFGLDLTFSGIDSINANSITIGNGAGCLGSSGGGTTFCNSPFGSSGIWQAFLTGPTSISFRAQNLSQVLENGEYFFVNVFFNGTVSPTNFSFSGVWLTDFSPNPNPVPVPAALPLLASGLGALGFAGWRRQKNKRTDLAA